MRFAQKLFTLTVFCSLCSLSLLSMAQAPSAAAPATEASSDALTPSSILQPSLDQVLKTMAALNMEKWKKGTIRDEAGADVSSIQRDLKDKVPTLMKTADAAQGNISGVLPLLQHVGALYDVLVHVEEGSRVSAPPDQVAALQQSLASLEKARLALGDRMVTLAQAQEKQIGDLRRTVQTQTVALHAAQTPAATTPCPAPKPAPAKKPKKKVTPPATATPGAPAAPATNNGNAPTK
jgi:hypothetical protein